MHLQRVNIGVFGAGHLGRAIAQGLLEAGFPRARLALCHGGSAETRKKLEQAELLDLAVDSHELVRRSQVLLYLVRPQNDQAIAGHKLRKDALLASFLAGVSLDRLPLTPHGTRKVRVMISAPDTLRMRNGIAARFPAGDPVFEEILALLPLQLIPLRGESDFHAFTAFGPCLPVALTCWETQGKRIHETEIVKAASRIGLDGWEKIVVWAQSVRPRHLTAMDRFRYVRETATPGGVTEAILQAMELGFSFTASLEQGIRRSQELASTLQPAPDLSCH